MRHAVVGGTAENAKKNGGRSVLFLVSNLVDMFALPLGPKRPPAAFSLSVGLGLGLNTNTKNGGLNGIGP